MALGFDDKLDAPPQSPQQPTMPPGGLGSLAGGGMSSSAPVAQPVLQGILDGGVQIGLMFDSFAQATPQFAHLLDACKQSLQEYLGQLVAAGAGPTGPTAPGAPFPGGGFGRGPMPL